MLSGIRVVGEHRPEGQFPGPLFRNAVGYEPVNQLLGHLLIPGRDHARGDVKELGLGSHPVRNIVPFRFVPSSHSVFVPQSVVWPAWLE